MALPRVRSLKESQLRPPFSAGGDCFQSDSLVWGTLHVCGSHRVHDHCSAVNTCWEFLLTQWALHRLPFCLYKGWWGYHLKPDGF